MSKEKLTSEQEDALQSLMQSVNSGIEYQVGSYTPDPNKVIYVMDQNGLYQVRETKLARFFIKMTDAKIPGLPVVVNSKIELKIPKVPFEVFEDLLDYYREVYKEMHTEVGALIYFNPENGEFFPFIQKQIIGGAETTFDPGDPEIRDLNERYILVLETHSHHTMRGRFSSQDNRVQDELNGINLVIGDIFSRRPEWELRFCLGENRVNLELSDVFSMKEAITTLKPEYQNWRERCRTREALRAMEKSKNTDKTETKGKGRGKKSLESQTEKKPFCEVIKIPTPFTRFNHDMLNSNFQIL